MFELERDLDWFADVGSLERSSENKAEVCTACCKQAPKSEGGGDGARGETSCERIKRADLDKGDVTKACRKFYRIKPWKHGVGPKENEKAGAVRCESNNKILRNAGKSPCGTGSYNIFSTAYQQCPADSPGGQAWEKARRDRFGPGLAGQAAELDNKLKELGADGLQQCKDAANMGGLFSSPKCDALTKMYEALGTILKAAKEDFTPQKPASQKEALFFKYAATVYEYVVDALRGAEIRKDGGPTMLQELLEDPSIKTEDWEAAGRAAGTAAPELRVALWREAAAMNAAVASGYADPDVEALNQATAQVGGAKTKPAEAATAAETEETKRRLARGVRARKSAAVKLVASETELVQRMGQNACNNAGKNACQDAANAEKARVLAQWLKPGGNALLTTEAPAETWTAEQLVEYHGKHKTWMEDTLQGGGGVIDLTGHDGFLAIGDPHGDFHTFQRLLFGFGIINALGHWARTT